MGNCISQDSVFTCDICFNLVSSTKRFINNGGKCKYHSYCTDCVEKHVEAKLEVYNLAQIKCPGLDCNNLLDPLACRSFLSSKVFVRWCDVLCESTVNQYQKNYCPFNNCSALILNECGDHITKSTCPSCKGLFCFKCGRPWHAGFSCNEARSMNKNDLLFCTLMEKTKWRRCPSCKHCVERSEGCRIIKCRCGIAFCYLCGRKVAKHHCPCRVLELSEIVAGLLVGVVVVFLCFLLQYVWS